MERVPRDGKGLWKEFLGISRVSTRYGGRMVMGCPWSDPPLGQWMGKGSLSQLATAAGWLGKGSLSQLATAVGWIVGSVVRDKGHALSTFPAVAVSFQ